MPQPTCTECRDRRPRTCLECTKGYVFVYTDDPYATYPSVPTIYLPLNCHPRYAARLRMRSAYSARLRSRRSGG